MQKQTRRVVLISPDDVENEIDTIRQVIRMANQLNSHQTLDVWYWRTDATPGLHLKGPQGLSDDQMQITDADLVIAVFWTRLGTPVFDEASGTAHELKLAWDSWRLTGKPNVFVYFCLRDIPQDSLSDLNQYPVLQAFKRAIPPEQVYHNFKGLSDLHVDFTKHLGKWLQDTESEKQVASAPAGVFTPPDASRTVARPDQLDQLKAAFAAAPLVTLCGISGSGKTRLAAQYVASETRHREHWAEPLWYDVPDDGTLDEMLTAIPTEYVGSGDLSPLARCKNLLTTLRLRGQLLVLDDFHRADRASYAHLLRVAGMQSAPGSICLLSRTALYLPDSKEVSLRAWTVPEIDSLLAQLGGPALSRPLLLQLAQRTGGLPLAIKFFGVLVNELGYSPARLLGGSLPQIEQATTWYSEIKDKLNDAQLSLLRYFSLAEPYITEPVLRRAEAQLRPAERAQAFIRLQTLLLVESRQTGRWAVHPFVAEHTLSVTDVETKRKLLSDLCAFSRAGIRNRRPTEINYVSLAAGIRACRYAQRADDVDQSAAIIDQISSAAKRLGHYGALRDLCRWQVARQPLCNPWIKYHLAHCEVILGNPRAAVTLLTVLRTEKVTRALTYSAARILADARAQLGDVGEAVAELRAVIEEGQRDKKLPKTFDYARNTLADLLIRSRQLDEAAVIVNDLARTVKDDRSLGVVMMLLGQIERTQSARSAEQRFRAAMGKFRASEDRRGVAWAQRCLAEALLARPGDNRAEIRRHVREALSTYSRTGEMTADYGDWLERVRPRFADDPSTLILIDQERLRSSSDLGLGPADIDI